MDNDIRTAEGARKYLERQGVDVDRCVERGLERIEAVKLRAKKRGVAEKMLEKRVSDEDINFLFDEALELYWQIIDTIVEALDAQPHKQDPEAGGAEGK